MIRFFTLFILLSVSLLAQTKKHTLLMNGTAHIGNSIIIENSYVAIKDDKIELVADARTMRIDITKFDTVINLFGKHIYPGLIAPNCIIGLQEAEAVKATNDYAEVGDFNPHIRSLIAYNTDSKILQTVKANGVLYVQSTPRDGVLSGTSSILATDAWNWEDAVIKIDDGVHLNFPKSIQKNGWWAEPLPSDKNNKYNEELKSLKSFFENAFAY
jgi:imidazolonepropionase-like amidohydrolase